MNISKEELTQILVEEVALSLKSLLLEQKKFKIPGDKTYEYSLSPDGKGYYVYKNGVQVGGLQTKGLETVVTAAPADVISTMKSKSLEPPESAGEDKQSWYDWVSGLLGFGSGEKEEVKPAASQTAQPQEQPKPDWSRETDKAGPIHKLQGMLGFTGAQADGVFGKNSRLAWTQQTNGMPLPESPVDAVQVLQNLRQPKEEPKPETEKTGGFFDWLFGSGEDEQAPGEKPDPQSEGLVFYENLPANLKANKEALENGEFSVVARCKPTGCAQYVSDTLKTTGGSRGNAWHQHRLSKLKYTSFKFTQRQAETAASLLTRIDSNPEINFEKEVKSFVQEFIPPQMALARIMKLGDIVGLYYEDSHNFVKAFREAATRTTVDASGTVVTAAADGPFFKKEDGKWRPGDTILGKKDPVVISTKSKARGKTLGKGFGMNTHLGFVGALNNGEPIIFHQVYGQVYAEPLRYVASDESKIKVMWIKEAELKADKEQELVSEQYGSTADRRVRDALKKTLKLKPFLMKSLGIDAQTLSLLTNAAISITGRESDYGYGKRYLATDWLERAASYLGAADPSIGPAQMRYGMHFGDKDAQFKDFGAQVGINSPLDMSDYTKSVLGCIALLSSLYKKALKEGYNPSKPGVASVDIVSTGNGALDIAIVAYNAGSSVITSYCGRGEVKVKCSEIEYIPSSIRTLSVENYIPNYKTKITSGRILSSTGYLSEVASRMKEMGTIKI